MSCGGCCPGDNGGGSIYLTGGVWNLNLSGINSGSYSPIGSYKFDNTSGLGNGFLVQDASRILKNLYVKIDRDGGKGQSLQISITKNNVLQLLSVTFSHGDPLLKFDLVNTVAVVQGDIIRVEVTRTTGGAGDITEYVLWSFQAI
jgi:hypothetical protein